MTDKKEDISERCDVIRQQTGKKTKDRKLTPQEMLFCKYYLETFNGSLALDKAGYSGGNHNTHYHLKKPHIHAYLMKQIAERAEKVDITAEDVLRELKAIAFYDINDFLKENGEVKSISDIPVMSRKAVTGLDIIETYDKDGNKIITRRIKLSDKNKSLTNIMKHLGMFERDNKQKETNINLGVIALPSKKKPNTIEGKIYD